MVFSWSPNFKEWCLAGRFKEDQDGSWAERSGLDFELLHELLHAVSDCQLPAVPSIREGLGSDPGPASYQTACAPI